MPTAKKKIAKLKTKAKAKPAPKARRKPAPPLDNVKLTARAFHSKGAPSNAFQPGNTIGFKPGQSGSPGGKPHHGAKRLLSRAITVFLSDKAPFEVAKTLGLSENPPGSGQFNYSWAQCLAKSLIVRAIKGESWAVAEIARMTEPQRSRLTLGYSEDDEDENSKAVIELILVDGVDGRPSPAFLEANPDFVMPVPRQLPRCTDSTD